jgi:cell division ATPase FtsA
MVAIKDKEVTQADLARVMETAKAPSTSPATSGCCWWSLRNS